MGKRKIFITLLLLVLIVAGVLFCFYGPCRPFGDLTMQNVQTVSLDAGSESAIELTEEQRKAFLSILGGIWIPREALGADEYYGSTIIFCVTQKDGTEISISIAAPLFREHNAHFKRDDAGFKVPEKFWNALLELYNGIV